MHDQASLLHKIDECLGAYILTMCYEHYLTDTEICFDLNVCAEELRQIKRGTRPITATELYLLCNLLEVTPNFFFQGMLKRIQHAKSLSVG